MNTDVSAGTPKVSFYGDDFTGATANLAGFQNAGLSALLFLDTPTIEQVRKHASGLDVLGIAGISRALRATEMRAEIEPAFRLFKEIGSRIVQYKICSTFDSSPEIGSFGVVLDMARAHLGCGLVPVFAACPSFGRWTLFANHFANFRGETFRLDRHPVMSRHPSTPMDEADLRRHLERQTGKGAGLIDIQTIRRGAEQIASEFDRLSNTQTQAVVMDGFDESDVDAVAAFMWSASRNKPIFTLSAQGLAAGLGRHLAKTMGADGDETKAPTIAPVDRMLVLSGSASMQTAIQITRAVDAGWYGVRLPIDELLKSRESEEALFLSLSDDVYARMASGTSVVVYTALGSSDYAIEQSRAILESKGISADKLVAKVGDFFGRLSTLLVQRLQLKRIVLAGGDTSSQAMRRIDAFGLSVLRTHSAGGSISRLHSENSSIDGLQVLLKAGQAGSDDVFIRAMSGEGW